MPTTPAPAPATTLPRRELDQATADGMRALAYELAGLRIPAGKRQLMENRLHPRLRALGLTDFAAYLALLGRGAGNAERQHFLECLTTNETFFFRHKQHWDFLATSVVPHCRQRPLKLWSAACSSGEEPYSAAMLLLDLLGEGGAFRIAATDLDRQIIARARQATYQAYALQKVTEVARQRFFEAVGPQTWRLRPPVREAVRFKQHNLMQASGFSEVDVVLLRNVLIYFDAASKAVVLRHICAAMRPGGYLLLGGSESLDPDGLPLRYHAPNIYQRV